MKNNKTSKSCSSNNAAMPMQSQEAPSSKLLQFSADITKLKPSNDGKSVRMSACPTGRALVVDKNKVISVSTKDAGAFVKELGKLEMVLDRDSSSPHWMCLDLGEDETREDLCPELYREINLRAILAYENKLKLAKVVGLKAAKHDNHNALEFILSTEDLEPRGATADDAVKWVFKDIVGKKGVSITLWRDFEYKRIRLSLYDLLENDKDLETIEKAINAADLAQVLHNENGDGFTLFAPNDRAFDDLPVATVKNLFKARNKPQLVKILQKHVVSGKFDSKRLKIIAKSPNNHLRALDGSHLDVIMRGSALYVGNAKVVAADVEASNGYLHKIGALVESKK
jgi:uncharacterized surface protein with fasciclin (FAS1) repeats